MAVLEWFLPSSLEINRVGKDKPNPSVLFRITNLKDIFYMSPSLLFHPGIDLFPGSVDVIDEIDLEYSAVSIVFIYGICITVIDRKSSLQKERV